MTAPMPSLLLTLLCASALLPPLLLLGYPLVLFLARRPSPPDVAGEAEEVAVVIPTLNEEGYLPGKLSEVGRRAL